MDKRRVVRRAALVSLLPFVSETAAQAGPQADVSNDEAGTIIVIGSRTGEISPTDTAVSDRDIDRLAPTTLRDALDDLPGTRAFETQGAAGGTFLSVRGGEPNFTLVTIEGIRVTDSTNSVGGAFDFGLIDPAIVRKVELVPLASSATQGPDALAGVVNIRLREPQPMTLNAGARVDALGPLAGGASGSLNQGWRNGAVIVSVGAFDSGGVDPHSRLRRGQGMLIGRQRLRHFQLSTVVLHARSNRSDFPESSGGPLFAQNRQMEEGTGRLDAIGVALRPTGTARITPALSAYWSEVGGRTTTPAIAAGVLSGVPSITANNSLRRFEGVAELAGNGRVVSWTAALTGLEEIGRSTGSILFGVRIPTTFELRRRSVGGLVEGTFRASRDLLMNGALRSDWYDGAAPRLSWRGGVSWRPKRRPLTLFARAGNGYKQPSFYALGNPLVGNPLLRPERSWSGEAGARLDGRWSWVSVTAFRNRYVDLIDFDPLAFRIVNRAHVTTSGLEFAGATSVGEHGALVATFTHLDVNSETPLLQRPKWFGSLRATWRPARDFELAGRVAYEGARFDSSVPTGLVRLPRRIFFDVSANRTFGHLAVNLAVRNVGNTRNGDAIGFPAERRSFRLTLTWQPSPVRNP
jgi:outer membrane receptor protein involved in Fe transport